MRIADHERKARRTKKHLQEEIRELVEMRMLEMMKVEWREEKNGYSNTSSKVGAK